MGALSSLNNLVVQQGTVNGRSKPTTTPIADNNSALAFAVRMNGYREQYSTVPTQPDIVLADEGSLFVSTNPTPGTGLAGTVSATYSNPAPFAWLLNTAATGGVRCYLRQLKLIVTVAAASGTTVNYAILSDPTANALATNHMTAITPVLACADTSLSVSPKLQVYTQTSATASAITAPSANAKVQARGSLGGLTIVGDELVINFGSGEVGPATALTAAQATYPGRKATVAPPVVLGPGVNAFIYLWFANNSSTGISYELEMTHYER